MFFLLPFAFLLLLVLLFSLSRGGLRLLQRLSRAQEGREPPEDGPPSRPRADSRSLGLRRRLDPEARVFRLAYKRRGRLTVSDVVIDLGIPMRQAEELLNRLEDGQRVRLEVAPNGLVVYEFPEILARFQDI